jgi:hypothetical protein
VRVALQSDISEEDFLQKMDKILVKAMDRINSGDALKASAFNDMPELGGKRLVDVCQTLNTSQLAIDLGGVEFSQANPQRLFVFYAGASVKETVDKRLQSSCTLNFRTQKDIAAQKDKPIEPDPTTNESAYNRRFIHTISMASTLHSNDEGAKKALETIRSSANTPAASDTPQLKLEEISLGDSAIKSQQNNETGSATVNYYVQKGQYVYFITILSAKQQQPFVSEGYTITDQVAAKVVDALTDANQ